MVSNLAAAAWRSSASATTASTSRSLLSSSSASASPRSLRWTSSTSISRRSLHSSPSLSPRIASAPSSSARQALLLSRSSGLPRLPPSPFLLAASSQIPASRHLSLWPSSKKTEPEVKEQVQDALRSTTEAGSATVEEAKAEIAGAAESISGRVEQAKDSAVEAASNASSSIKDAVSSLDPGALTAGSETVASALAGPTVHEIAQNHWFLVSSVQKLLDWTTTTTGLPWWVTIAAVTVSIRVLVLPLTVYGQANSIRMANIQPKMKLHMDDLQAAKRSGDLQTMTESAKAVQKLMKENDCHPGRSFVLPAVQMPLFLTFFMALRGLANGGLPSLKEGGFSWITDLTVADPYYAMPIIASSLTLLVVESGAETGATTPQASTIKNVIRIATVVMIPFISSLPAAVFIYWTTNNTFSLLQLLFLRSSLGRNLFNIPERIKHQPDTTYVSRRGGAQAKEGPKGFWDAVKSGMDVVNTPQSAASKRVSSISKPRAVAERSRAGMDGRAPVEARREGALQSLMSSTNGDKAGPVSSALASDPAAEKAWKAGAGAVEGTAEGEAEVTLEDPRLARAEKEADARRKRVAAANQRRKNRARH